MLRIPCPYCGVRDHAEFDYAGDATVVYPPMAAPEGVDEDAHRQAWYEAVYLRDDPKGPHRELWRHSRGCRCWIIVERDTVTHEITSARLAHPGFAAAITRLPAAGVIASSGAATTASGESERP